MSIRLDDPDVRAAYEEIRNGQSTDWLIMSYGGSRDRLSLYNKGTQGIDELVVKLITREVQFGLVRIDGRVLLFHFIPEQGISGVIRARALVHFRAVASAFRHAASFTASSPEDLITSASRVRSRLEGQASNHSSAPASPNPPQTLDAFGFSSPSQFKGPYRSGSKHMYGASSSADPTRSSPLQHTSSITRGAASSSPLSNGLAQMNIREEGEHNNASTNAEHQGLLIPDSPSPSPRPDSPFVSAPTTQPSSRPSSPAGIEDQDSIATAAVSAGVISRPPRGSSTSNETARAQALLARDSSLASPKSSLSNTAPAQLAQQQQQQQQPSTLDTDAGSGTQLMTERDRNVMGSSRSNRADVDGVTDASTPRASWEIVEREEAREAVAVAEPTSASSGPVTLPQPQPVDVDVVQEGSQRVRLSLVGVDDAEAERRAQVEKQERAQRAAEADSSEREATRRAREAFEAQERAQLEFERRERELADSQAAALAEKQRLEQVERDRRLREAEEDRLREEARIERERAKAEEDERVRQARAEEERLIANQRLEAQLRQEAELRRKEEERIRARAELQAKFVDAKRDGEVMLQGHVSAQGGNSMLWRRRWFELRGHQITLFRSEHDVSNPINVVPLANSVRGITENPEEAAMPNSLKLNLKNEGDEWMFYTDTLEDRELLIAAISIAADLRT